MSEVNRSTDHEICRHCGGTGKIENKAALSFPIGADVWWNSCGYGYQDRVPGKVVAHSKSGKTVRVRFTAKSLTGIGQTYETVSTVHPRMLEIRNG